MELGLLQKLRLQYAPLLPTSLQNIQKLVIKLAKSNAVSSFQGTVGQFFPKLSSQASYVSFAHGIASQSQSSRVGVVLSGGQAAGGHNVITGLFDALKKIHPSSRLFGFLDGPKGIIENRYRELTLEILADYRNQGGFDLIGSGRTKIETPEQFQAALTTVKALNLDGLVIIGGDDSNTNAALLAEFFLREGCQTTVVGVPKTIDGDLKNEDIEISFGFDTATKIYSEIIGNIARDALSAKKSYYFIKLMGRSASHITLECALQTHPNLAFIGEEVAANKHTLNKVTQEICDLICQRAALGKDYGVILIPEGIIEFIPEFKKLIAELNQLLSPEQSHAKMVEELSSLSEKIRYLAGQLTQEAANCFNAIPNEIQAQLLLDRDPHGNVQVSKIETERLFIETVRQELGRRKKADIYKGKFSGQPHFCGYEGRSGFPSNFDANYCYALGHVAALLVNAKATGYICCVHNLTRSTSEWQIGGRNLTTMMAMEKRHGKDTPVIAKALVDLNGQPFRKFQTLRAQWALEDDYIYPGPIQFYGPSEIVNAIPHILQT